MSLVARIYLGMGAMVALILLVGGFASLRTSGVADTFIEYRATAKASLIANEMSQSISKARLSALKYRASEDPQALEDATQAASEVMRLSPDFISALDGIGVQSSVRNLPQLMEEYSSAIAQVAQLRQRSTELSAITVESGRAARQKMTEKVQAAMRANDARTSAEAGVIKSTLILGRLYLERFLVSNQQSDFDRSKAEIESATVGLKELSAASRDSDTQAAAQSTLSDIDQFSAAANELVETVQARSVLYARMDQIGPEALGLVNTAVNAVVDQQNMLGPAGAELAEESITIVSTLVGLGAVIGIVLAFFSGRTISRRLQKVTDDMTELAAGNLDLDIEIGSQKHEIGKMTDAMAVFLENARKAKELDSEIETKEADKREQARIDAENAREKELQEERERKESEQREADRARMAMLENFQKDMERVMDEAASGNFSVRMADKIEDPNLSKLANLINQQLKSTETNVTDIVSGIGELAKGNLAVRIKGDRHGVFLAMQEDFNASVVTLSETMGKILRSGNSVSGTSVDLKNSSKDMSKRAEDNAATVEQTSAAVEEITASIRQVVASAKAADQATQRVRQSADETRAVSTETEASINAMTDASAQINRVVKVIEDIAFQINLLALNAGVEAARAGEAGLGFSVVASEVRNLALRSQEAVQEITQVIEQSNLSVEAGAQQVGLSRQALEGIITEVEVASGQISEIASAVEEQARGIEEVNTAIRAIDVTAQKNASTLETMMLSSQSLSEEASQLSAALGEFEGVSEKKPVKTPRPEIVLPTRKSKPAPKPLPKVAVAASQVAAAPMDDEGWDEF